MHLDIRTLSQPPGICFVICIAMLTLKVYKWRIKHSNKRIVGALQVPKFHLFRGNKL